MKSDSHPGGQSSRSKHWWLNKISKLETGQHISYLYDSDVEHRFVLTAFMTQGLLLGQKVIYITDVRSPSMIFGWIWSGGLKIDNYLTNGQFKVLLSDGAYLPDGTFDPRAMLSLLQAETNNALGEGFSALRVTGEMTWAPRGALCSDRLLEYESRVTPLLAGIECLAMCQYDKREFDFDFLESVVEYHPVRFGTAG